MKLDGKAMLWTYKAVAMGNPLPHRFKFPLALRTRETIAQAHP